MTNDPDQVDASARGAETTDEDSSRSIEDTEERPDGDLDAEPDDDERPGRSGSGRLAAPVAVWIAVVLIGLGVFALLRVAGEQRYQSCVAAAAARSQGATDT